MSGLRGPVVLMNNGPGISATPCEAHSHTGLSCLNPSTRGDRTFSVVAPESWNGPPSSAQL